jgi:polyisoprenoid-binding protein YceI
MKFLAALAVVTATLLPQSNPIRFDMKDPKGVSGMSIKIDSKLEPVHGQATGVSGDVVFDPAKPENSSGKIVVNASDVRLGSQALTDAMLQDWCLDVQKFPTIEFAIKKVRGVKKVRDGEWNATVDGTFTLKGKSRDMTVKANVRHLPNMIKTRGGMPKDGDLLLIRSTFKFNRLDFGVAPDLNTNVIGNTVEIDLSTVGVAPR